MVKLILQPIPKPVIPEMTLDPAQVAERNSLLGRSRAVETVTDADHQTDAVAAGRDIRSYVKAVGEARKQATQPLDEAKARIMDLECELLNPLKAEQARIERLVADFAEQERRRVEAAERAKHAEVERLERERVEAEEKARRASEKMATEAGLERALEAERKAREAEEAVQAAVRERPASAARAAGVAVKRDVANRVTDVRALYAARPELCRLEPNAAAIRATCFPRESATESDPDTTTVPGLALWWETRASLRTR